MVPHGRHAAGYRDGREGRAPFERIVAYAGQASGHRYRCKGRASVECIGAYLRDAVRYAFVCDRGGDRDLGQQQTGAAHAGHGGGVVVGVGIAHVVKMVDKVAYSDVVVRCRVCFIGPVKNREGRDQYNCERQSGRGGEFSFVIGYGWERGHVIFAKIFLPVIDDISPVFLWQILIKICAFPDRK